MGRIRFTLRGQSRDMARGHRRQRWNRSRSGLFEVLHELREASLLDCVLQNGIVLLGDADAYLVWQGYVIMNDNDRAPIDRVVDVPIGNGLPERLQLRVIGEEMYVIGPKRHQEEQLA